MSLVWLIVIPFAGSVIAGLLPANARNAEAWLSGAVALVGVAILVLLYPHVGSGEVVRFERGWMPELGLNFVLRVDGFAWMFAMLVYGIGALVILYARYYMSPEDPVPRFFSFLLAFLGAMLGIVLSGNLIQLVFFWELTSLFSFLLIGYWHHHAAAREGARMALIVTSTGGLALLAGVLIIGHIVGSYDLDVVLASGRMIVEHELYLPALILVLLGALTKSAQFPFQFWLPHAMVAPTPVSAYLHSATMVKAGVFLMARLWPVLSGTTTWFYIVGSAGLITLTLGGYKAIFQKDLKGLLAYSTISHLGLITLLLGLNTPTALVAAVFHIMNHATFKASLFLVAGVVDHETGTRDFSKLGGLARKLPVTAALAMVASAAMAGVPLLNGFLSKEMFFAETVLTHGNPTVDWILPTVATIAAVFSVTYSLRFAHGVFFGPEATELPRLPKEPPRWMRFPIEFLVIACLIVGIIPAIAIQPFLGPAVESILLDLMPTYSLAVWHGFNLPLLMSFVALIGGILLYVVLKRRLPAEVESAPGLPPLDGKQIFDRVLVTVSWRWSRALERVFGTRRLQPQLGLIVLVVLLAGYLPLRAGALEVPALTFHGVNIAFLTFWVFGAMAAAGSAVVASYHRLSALVMMGAAGLIVILTFVWLSAPDLAITQLLVEIVTLVLLLLGLRWLPKRVKEDRLPSTRRRVVLVSERVRDLALAVASGVGIAVIAYATMMSPLPDTASRFYLENAYTQGGGTNVVNVILVDFRAMDTLGEIAVLGIVALTVFALLRRFRPAPDSVIQPRQQRLQGKVAAANGKEKDVDLHEEFMFIPREIMHWVFPMIWVLAAYLFVRGHDVPGGGFAAGITLSIAFIVQYMAGGTYWVEERLHLLPMRWMAFGLLIAVLTGAGAWLFGRPFLTSFFQYTEIPFIGSVPTASALLFDLGVFMLVVGATTLILVALAHQSIRGRRSPHPPRRKQSTVEEG